jgi:hypothetical protein
MSKAGDERLGDLIVKIDFDSLAEADKDSIVKQDDGKIKVGIIGVPCDEG